MHKRLMDPVLKSLDGRRSAYFADVAQELEGYDRVARHANLVFLFLAASAPYLPVHLPKRMFIMQLLAFVERNMGRIVRAAFEPGFLVDNRSMLPLVDEFVKETTASVLQRYDEGVIADGDVETEFRLGWPIDTDAFPYDDGAVDVDDDD